MKILSKEIKKCDATDGTKIIVLELLYSHLGETGKVLIRDYNPKLYNEYIKDLRKQVSNLYVEQKLKSEA